MKDLPARLREPLGGVFYLHGEDHFRKEQAVRALVESHLDPVARDFNFDQLRGSEVDAETLASVLGTPPMMADWRVVVLREVEGLTGSRHARDVLLRTVSAPPPGLALVMSCTPPERSKAKIYKDLERLSRSAAFTPISEADAPGWIVGRARELHGCEVDVDAARALAVAIGTDLGVLARELEKLSEFVGERRRITLEDVRAAGTELPAQDRWAWLDMVAEGRLDEAQRTLPALLGQAGESGVGVVIALTTQLLRIGVFLDRGPRGLEETLPPYQRWLAKSVARQAKAWTPEAVDHALERLLEADRRLKSGRRDDLGDLETWLMELRVRAEAA